MATNHFLEVSQRNRSLDNELFGLLDAICQQFEIGDSKFAQAKERYDGIAEYLNDSDSPLKKYAPIIYPQGSVNIGTTVSPVTGNEFDVDVICQLNVSSRTTHESFVSLVYDRLEQRGCYTLKKMNRCVRVQYANAFHIDVTPSIADPAQGPENILVTDKEIGRWKESNPKDYAAWFRNATEIHPAIAYTSTVFAKKAAVEPLPEPTYTRPLLNRIVQLLKRHRDGIFKGAKEAPISAIITTLATHAYRTNAAQTHDSQLAFVLSVIRDMPNHFTKIHGWRCVPNPANIKENYADKWQSHPEREKAFDSWHQNALGYFSKLFKSDWDKFKLTEELTTSYGEGPVKQAMIKVAERRKADEDKLKIAVSKSSGALLPSAGQYKASSSVVPVLKHTNFGQ